MKIRLTLAESMVAVVACALAARCAQMILVWVMYGRVLRNW